MARPKLSDSSPGLFRLSLTHFPAFLSLCSIHDEDITAVDISHNGRFLASGQRGSTRVKGYPAFVAVWEVATGEPLLCLEGLTQVLLFPLSPTSFSSLLESEHPLLLPR